jgi:hypothetical protein
VKAVLFVAENLYGPRFWVPFFTKLKAETGVKVYCLAPSFAHVNDYSKHDVVDGIFAIDDVLASYGDFEPDFDGEAVQLAQDFEQRYSANLIDVIQGDRHLGRGMYYLGHHHPRSRNSQVATLGRSIRYIDRLSERLDEFCSAHDIGTFITSGVGSDFTKVMCMIARARGIDIRILFSSRSGQYFTWYEDEYFGHSKFLSQFEKLRESGSKDPLPFVKAPSVNQGDIDVWNRALRLTRYGHALKRAVGLIIGEMRFILVRQIKYRDQPRFNRYLLIDRIKHLLKKPKQWRDLVQRVSSEDTFHNHRYVFYALQVEPETSTTVLAPEFNNQMAIIDLIVKSLPADVLFVIKEHMPAVGRRPDDFYEWLSEIPNVRLAHPKSDAPSLARNAALVVTLTGTIGIEAATAGVPVLTFGRHNLYNAISHVHPAEDVFSLRQTLRALLERHSKSSESDRAGRQREGQLFLRSLQDVSCDVGEDVMFHGDPTVPVSPRTIEGLCGLLIAADSRASSRPARRKAASASTSSVA